MHVLCPSARTVFRRLASVAIIIAALAGPRTLAARWDHPDIGLPVLRVFDARETGISYNYRCTLRAANGRLYLGHDGLLEFDGETWRPMPIPSDAAVRALGEDETGRIWVGGENVLGYLSPSAVGPATFTSIVPLLPVEHRREIGSVSSVFALPGGVAVAVTDTRVFCIRPNGVQAWVLPAQRRLSAWRDAAGGVYIVQPGTGTLLVGPADLGPADFPEPYASAGVEWAVRLEGGIRLFGTADRLIRQHAERLEPLANRAAAILRDDRVTAAAPLAGGFAALGTLRHGVLILDAEGNLVSTIDRAAGLPDNRVVHLAASPDHGVSVTTPEAVAWFCDEPQATVFDQRQGLQPGPVPAIARTGSGLVLANGKRILLLEPPSQPRTRPHCRVLAELPDNVTGLRPFRSGLITASTNALSALDPASGTVELLRQGDIPAHSSWSGQSDGLAWIERSGFFRGALANGTLRALSAPLEVDTDASSLIEGEDGAHWFSTLHSGVFRVAPADPAKSGRPVVRNYRNNLRRSGVAPPQLFRVGRHVAITTVGGIALHTATGDRFVTYPGITDARIHAISAPEADGTVWLALSQRDRFPFQVRIARLRPDGETLSCELVRLPPLPLEVAPTALLAEPGPVEPARTFWIGLPGQLLRIDSPGTPTTNPPFTPEIAATELLADGRGLRPIRPELPRVEFENAGIRFDLNLPGGRLGQRVHLEARLVDFDPDWVPLGEIPSRVFRGLRDRAYRFEARTIDALGRPSPAAVIEFSVLAPWWRSPAAYAAYALGLVLLSGLVFFTRSRLDRRHRRELEALVSQRTHELAAANAAKSEFLAHINHEIRNPLNGVIGLSGMLAQQHQDDHSRQLARSLRACASYLGSVVDNVLDLARIEAGRIELAPQSFEPRNLVADVAEMFRLQVEETGGRISWSVDPELPQSLFGDSHRIRQVLVNFTANAARYARGGDVRLSVRRRSESDQHVIVVFTVADTGPGISPTEQSRIFEKFTRGQSAGETTATRGHGVGLALVRNLAELLGGEADVDSQLGFGAKFRLTIPLRFTPTAAAPAMMVPLRAIPALRVLVIDDQGFNRLVLRDQLERLGCRVEESADGHSAYLLLQARAHHIAFVDLDLPGLDGLNLIKRVRADAGGQPVFLVATTASATRGIEELVLAAGADAFLPKPISLPLLVTLLETCATRNRDLPDTAAAPFARPEPPSTPAGGLFADLPLSAEIMRDLLAALDVEVSALATSWRLAEAPAARRHAHRIASLGILARDETLIAAARHAEDALQTGRPVASQLVDALQGAARARIKLLADEVAAARRDHRN